MGVKCIFNLNRVYVFFTRDYHVFFPVNNVDVTFRVNYRQVPFAKSVRMEGTSQNGLSCSFYDGLFKNSSLIKGIGDKKQVVDGIVVPDDFVTAAFALKYKGYIKVPATGIYTFYLTCDDGGKLYIANSVIVDNDGLHSAIEKSGQAALTKGTHPFLLDFIEGGGGFTLKLKYSFNGGIPRDIPDRWFVH